MHSPWRMVQSAGDADAKLSAELTKRVWRFARPYRGKIAALFLVIGVSTILGAIPPLLYKAVIDVAIPKKSVGTLNILAVALLGVAAAGALAQVATRYYSSHVGEGVIFDLRLALFDHVQRMPVAFFTRSQTGALTSRLTSDLIGGHRAFTETLSSVAGTVLGVAVTVGAMFFLNWRLTLLAMAIVPIFVLVIRRMRGRLHDLMVKSAGLNAELSSQMTERFQIGGALLLKLFGSPERESEGFGERAGKLREVGVETAVFSRVFHVTFGIVAAAGIGLVYWLGGRMVIGGSVSIGTIVAFTAYLSQLYAPITMLAAARVDLAAALVSFQRVFEVLDFPTSIAEREGAFDLVEPKGHVEFRGVWFRYPQPSTVSPASLQADQSDGASGENAWVLKDLSFEIPPGRTVALVGPSGAGKTTMSLLVPRLYDATEGSILVDGSDVRDLTGKSLRAAVGMVMQDAHLFHDTIRSNLLYAKPGASEAEMIEAAKAAQIHQMIAGLPDGYETVVGERGYRLSGGEKQRVAIARLLLKDPAIMILDEATAHLDSESESLIQAALAEALANRSSLVIAHRLSTIVSADQILVVDEGRIVEKGTHFELLMAGGLYEELYKIQFERTAAAPGREAVGT